MNPTYLVIFSVKDSSSKAHAAATVVTDKFTAASPLKVIENLKAQYGSNLMSITGITGLRQAAPHKNVWISL